MEESVAAFILAGGRSTRFGSDKARALVDGSPLIVRVARLADAAGLRPVTAIAREVGAYDDLGVTTLADIRPGQGPLAGLETALLAARSSDTWVALLTCDLLVLDPVWVATLCAARASAGNAGAIVFADDVRFQPAPGLYHARLLPRLQKRLASAAAGLGKASFQALLDEAMTVRLPLPANWPPVISANRPTDLS